MAKLVFHSGNYTGKVVGLPAGKVTVIGRNRDVELPLPDLKLSRRHCQIISSGDRFVLQDMNSTNGTFVNGIRVKKEVELESFDRIVMGDTEIEFHCDEKTEPVVVLDDGIAESEDSDAVETNVDMLQAAIHEMSLPLPPEPPSVAGAKTIRQSKILFCDLCNSSIPLLDWDLGKAKEVEKKLICAECLAKRSDTSIMDVSVKKDAGPPARKVPVSKNDAVDEMLAGLDQEAEIVDTTLKRRGVAIAEEVVSKAIHDFEQTTQNADAASIPEKDKRKQAPASKSGAKTEKTGGSELLGDDFEEIK